MSPLIGCVPIFLTCVLFLLPHTSPQFEDRSVGEPTLKYVVMVFRHGDRSPSRIIPMANYSAGSHWPNGFKQLTPLGFEQTYDLGQFFRNQYPDFVSESYDASEIRIQSTEEDRALDSARSMLRGLYNAERVSRPGGAVRLNGSSYSVPVGHDPQFWPIIETAPRNKDPMLKPSKYRCPVLDTWKSMSKSYFWNALEQDPENQKMVRYVQEKASLPRLTLQSIEDIYRPLIVQQIHGLGLPAWVTKQIWDRLTSLFRLAYTVEARDPVESKFRAGLLTGKLLQLLRNKVTSTAQTWSEKLRIFSTHAGTLLPLLSNLGIFDGEYPPYASALLVELWEHPQPWQFGNQTSDSNHFIKFKFRNGTDSQLYDLTPDVPGCDPDLGCGLESLEAALAGRVYKDQSQLRRDCLTNALQLMF